MDAKDMCKSWILNNTNKRKTVNNKIHSYRLKHIVERLNDTYIPEDCFIQAAIDLGYEYDQNSSCFNMSFEKYKDNVKRDLSLDPFKIFYEYHK